MIAELFPFWVNYWHYLSLAIVVFVLFNLTYKSGETKSNSTNQNELVTEIIQDLNEEEPALPEDLKHIPYNFTRLSYQQMRDRSQEFYETVNSRRTLRFFSSDPIPRDILHNIIKAAGTAPSGAHTEPWTFVLISSAETKAEVRKIIEKEEQLNYTKRMGKKWTTDLKPLKTDWHKEYLTDAPYLICIFKQTYDILPNGKKKNHYYNEMSVSIAAGILITAIQFAGLVTLTSTPLNCGPALRSLLNRPINEKLVLLLPVGYPASDATVPDLSRKPLSKILVEI